MGKAKGTKAKAGKSSKVATAVNVGKQVLGLGGKSSGGRKSRRKSIAWYANAIAKLKLKKRYEKLKYRV